MPKDADFHPESVRQIDGPSAVLTTMILLRRVGTLVAMMGLGGALLATVAGTNNAADGKPAEVLADREATAFFNGPVAFFGVLLPAQEMQSLREDPRKTVPATVTFGTERYEGVGIHIKGSAGSRRGIDDNPALTLSFGKFKPGQTFHGLKKIHLNNSVQDASRLNEMIASEMYHQAGIATPRVTQAFVKLNRTDLGLYVVKEGFDKTWLRRNFEDPSGNLYDGGFLQDVDADLKRDEGSGPEDRKDLHALAEAAEKRDAEARRQALEPILDLDKFTTFCALQNLLCDWDGYVYNHNNYRVYHEPRSGRFSFVPHGMDQMFGDTGFPLNRGMSGLVARQVSEFPGQRERFYKRIGQLMTNVFTAEVVRLVVAGAEARLKPALAQRRADEGEQLLRSMHELRDRALARVDNARQQMASRPKPLKFDAAGVAVITGWTPRSDPGKSSSDVGTAPDGTPSLSLACLAEGGKPSWRRRLRLADGKYVFEARVRSEGLKARVEPKGTGIGLRITGRNRTNSLETSSDWTVLSEPFEAAGGTDYEFQVEMCADAGKLWIDQGSLRLRRIRE